MTNPLYIAKYYQKKCFLEALPYLKGLVFDAGCGKQPYRSYFDNYVGMDSVNYSPDLIGDVRVIPLIDNCVDSVICSEVLEHIPNPNTVVRELARILKPNGKLYLTVPMYWYTHYAPHDYWRFTMFGLTGMLNDYFDIRYIKRYGGLNYFIACRIAESLKLPKLLMVIANWILLQYSKCDRWNKIDSAGWVVLAKRRAK